MKNISGKTPTKQPKKTVNDGFFNVDNPANWIVNDGKGTITNNDYYKRNNWWKKNKENILK